MVANVRHRIAAAWLGVSIGASRTAGSLPALPTNILVVRLDDIGDWVMTGPFLRELRAHYPAASISLVCKPMVAPLARRFRGVDDVIEYASARAPVPFDQFVALRSAAAFGKTLIDRHFDLAILPRRDNDDAAAAMIAWAAKVPARVGYPVDVTPLRAIKNRGYDRLLTHFVPSRSERHEVERTLDVVRFLGRVVADDCLEATIDLSDDLAAETLLDDMVNGWREVPLIAIAPGAAIDRRRWPAVRYGAVSAALTNGNDRRVIVIGGPGDGLLGRSISLVVGSLSSVIDMTGLATLPQTLALLGRCDLFIGNDSGPAHLAAAMKVPSIILSCHPDGASPDHANAPERFRPWSPQAEIVRPAPVVSTCRDGCVETTAHCILSIESADIICAAESRLSRSAAAFPAFKKQESRL